jgi:hypothetical protein
VNDKGEAPGGKDCAETESKERPTLEVEGGAPALFVALVETPLRVAVHLNKHDEESFRRRIGMDGISVCADGEHCFGLRGG